MALGSGRVTARGGTGVSSPKGRGTRVPGDDRVPVSLLGKAEAHSVGNKVHSEPGSWVANQALSWSMARTWCLSMWHFPQPSFTPRNQGENTLCALHEELLA